MLILFSRSTLGLRQLPLEAYHTGFLGTDLTAGLHCLMGLSHLTMACNHHKVHTFFRKIGLSIVRISQQMAGTLYLLLSLYTLDRVVILSSMVSGRDLALLLVAFSSVYVPRRSQMEEMVLELEFFFLVRSLLYFLVFKILLIPYVESFDRLFIFHAIPIHRFYR